jgi:hypothetical protein
VKAWSPDGQFTGLYQLSCGCVGTETCARYNECALHGPLDPWDSCLDVDPFTGLPEHEHGDGCPEGDCT